MGNLGYFTPKDGVMGLLASGDVSLGFQVDTDPRVWYEGLGKSCKKIALCNLFPRKMDEILSRKDPLIMAQSGVSYRSNPMAPGVGFPPDPEDAEGWRGFLGQNLDRKKRRNHNRVDCGFPVVAPVIA